jgi:hypothetical protein
MQSFLSINTSKYGRISQLSKEFTIYSSFFFLLIIKELHVRKGEVSEPLGIIVRI